MEAGTSNRVWSIGKQYPPVQWIESEEQGILYLLVVRKGVAQNGDDLRHVGPIGRIVIPATQQNLLDRFPAERMHTGVEGELNELQNNSRSRRWELQNVRSVVFEVDGEFSDTLRFKRNAAAGEDLPDLTPAKARPRRRRHSYKPLGAQKSVTM